MSNLSNYTLPLFESVKSYLTQQVGTASILPFRNQFKSDKNREPTRTPCFLVEFTGIETQNYGVAQTNMNVKLKINIYLYTLTLDRYNTKFANYYEALNSLVGKQLIPSASALYKSQEDQDEEYDDYYEYKSQYKIEFYVKLNNTAYSYHNLDSVNLCAEIDEEALITNIAGSTASVNAQIGGCDGCECDLTDYWTIEQTENAIEDLQISLENEISGLSASVATINSNIDSITYSISILDTNISGLSYSLDVLGASVSTLYTIVEGLTFSSGGGATGPEGPIGPTGPQGDMGLPGATGSVDYSLVYLKTETDAIVAGVTASIDELSINVYGTIAGITASIETLETVIDTNTNDINLINATFSNYYNIPQVDALIAGVTASIDAFSSSVAEGFTYVENQYITLAATVSGIVPLPNDYTLRDSGTDPAIQWDERELRSTTNVPTVKWDAGELWGLDNNLKIDWDGQGLFTDIATVLWGQGYLVGQDDHNVSVDWFDRNLYDATLVAALNWNSRDLFDAAGLPSINFQNRSLNNSSGTQIMDWEYGRLFNNAGVQVITFYDPLQLADSSGIPALDWSARQLKNTSYGTVLDWGTGDVYDFSGYQTMNIINRQLYDAVGNVSVKWDDGNLSYLGTVAVGWNSRYLLDSTGQISLGWGDTSGGNTFARGLFSSDGGRRVMDWDAGQVFNSDGVSLDWLSKSLHDEGTNVSLYWADRLLVGPENAGALNWYSRELYDSFNVVSVQWENRTLNDTSGVVTFAWGDRVLKDVSDVVSVDWANYQLLVNTTTKVDWGNHKLFDGNGGILSVDWDTRTLLHPDGATFQMLWSQDAGVIIRMIADNTGSPTPTIDPNNRQLIDRNGILALDWQNYYLYSPTEVDPILWWGDGIEVYKGFTFYSTPILTSGYQINNDLIATAFHTTAQGIICYNVIVRGSLTLTYTAIDPNTNNWKSGIVVVVMDGSNSNLTETVLAFSGTGAVDVGFTHTYSGSDVYITWSRAGLSLYELSGETKLFKQA